MAAGGDLAETAVAFPDAGSKPQSVGRSKVGPIDVHVGGRLRLARRARNLASPELAAALGVSNTQLFWYERGAHRIPVSRLYEAAVILKVGIAFFFEGLPVHRVESVDVVAAADEALAGFDAADLPTYRVAQALRQVPHEVRTAVAVMLETMIGVPGAFKAGRKPPKGDGT